MKRILGMPGMSPQPPGIPGIPWARFWGPRGRPGDAQPLGTPLGRPGTPMEPPGTSLRFPRRP